MADLTLKRHDARRFTLNVNPEFLVSELKKQGWVVTERGATVTRLSNGRKHLYAARIDILHKHRGLLWVGGSVQEGTNALTRVDQAVKARLTQKARQKPPQAAQTRQTVKQAPTRHAGEAVAPGGRVVILRGGR